MLKFPQKKFKWSGKAQSGFFIDFFLKKLIDVFIRNIFIFSAMFVGEKYMIERLTKKIIDLFLFKSAKFLGWTTFNFSWFFYVFLSFVFYTLLLMNLFLLFVS